MSKILIGVALSAAVVLALPHDAFAAAKKISYEEAFKRCKKYIDAETGVFAAPAQSPHNRTARGKACMQKFGYRI